MIKDSMKGSGEQKSVMQSFKYDDFPFFVVSDYNKNPRLSLPLARLHWARAKHEVTTRGGQSLPLVVPTCKQSDSGYREPNWPCCSCETALCQRWRRRRRRPVGEEGGTEISLRGWKDAVVGMWGTEKQECSADRSNPSLQIKWSRSE